MPYTGSMSSVPRTRNHCSFGTPRGFLQDGMSSMYHSSAGVVVSAGSDIGALNCCRPISREAAGEGS